MFLLGDCDPIASAKFPENILLTFAYKNWI